MSKKPTPAREPREVLAFRNLSEPRSALTRERTVVGVVWGEAAWKSRFAKVDSERDSLEIASRSTIEKWKKTPPPTEISKAYALWLTEFSSFTSEWGAFKGLNPWATDANDAMLQTFEKRIYQLRLTYDKLTGVEAVPTPPVEPYKPPVDATVGTLTDLVKWGAIGLIGFMAIKAVADSGILKGKGK